jgi:predicted nuclease with TOPRIM domain
MNLAELQDLIDKKTNESKNLHKQLNDLHQDLNKLRNQFNELEMQEFVDYLEIGEVIEFGNYYSFSGYCKDPKANTSFSSGEKIKISKKNKKSIVIEVVKKFQKRWDEIQKKSITIGETNPGWLIRVELNSFFHFYMKNSSLKAAFDSYVKRKHTLDSLFGE